MYLHLFTFKVFCTVVEEGSTSRAAKRLFLSQPAVSSHIKTIEDFYNTRFFNRMPKGLVLNKNGRELYKHVTKLINAFDRMSERFSKKGVDETFKCISIGVSTVPGVYFLPRILQQYTKEYSIELFSNQ